MATAEKVTKYSTYKARKYAKRQLKRLWRRLVKRDPETAPVRPPTKGWAD